MKINKYIMGLLMSLPFVSSCDNHIYEDASWHSWMPGMVYCSNGEIMSYENCVSKGNTPEAVLFFVDKEGVFSGKAYAVALNDYPDKEFIDPPDFVNAPPKLRFVARYVEKWFDCEVLLRQEECLSEVSPVLRHPYSDCRYSFGCLKHLIDTHPNLVNGNESLQFLIYLIGDEANADMCLYPTFCKMKHRTHFQSSF